jgi:asparagine synthase (glutamine-hydrolysing)
MWAPRIWEKLSPLPFAARKLLGAALSAVPVDGLSSLCAPFVGGRDKVFMLGNKVHKLADCLKVANDVEEMHRNLVSEWMDPGRMIVGEEGEEIIEPKVLVVESKSWPGMVQPLPMMYRDTMTYLPDDILCKVDRAAMANGLETRTPFLNHHVLEMACQMPIEMKIRGDTGKWALRNVLCKSVPKDLIERPKAGFAIPIGQWLRGPLRKWAENLISERRLSLEGYLKPALIRKVWSEHLSGQRDHSAKIWSVLMFQAWLENNS